MLKGHCQIQTKISEPDIFNKIEHIIILKFWDKQPNSSSFTVVIIQKYNFDLKHLFWKFLNSVSLHQAH
jgi:hypothetical protein